MVADCHVLCDITTDLSAVPLSDFDQVKEHKAWYSLSTREKYRIAEHEIRLVIGSTDIQFELWFKGYQYNKPNSIRVEWNEGASVVPDRTRVDQSILDEIRHRDETKRQKLSETF